MNFSPLISLTLPFLILKNGVITMFSVKVFTIDFLQSWTKIIGKSEKTLKPNLIRPHPPPPPLSMLVYRFQVPSQKTTLIPGVGQKITKKIYKYVVVCYN